MPEKEIKYHRPIRADVPFKDRIFNKHIKILVNRYRNTGKSSISSDVSSQDSTGSIQRGKYMHKPNEI